MPCYMQRTTTLEAPAANIEVMAAALRALGFDATVREQDRTIKLMTPVSSRASCRSFIFRLPP